MLAALNHPHIAAIYGIEDDEGIHALVLELVDGETLAERIARGPLPVTQALEIARQIADALDAAHEKGIVHRDLKPANIKITPEGVVKVLDFGLAKLESAGSGQLAAGGPLTESPTMTVDGTHTGLIVGTAAYMSPEQARGLAVDKRTDIWAFGCVLYEMLADRAAFADETLTDTLAAVLGREPNWAALAGTPEGVITLVRRCLEKDVKHRMRDIGDVLMELDARGDVTPPRLAARRPAAVIAAVVIVLVALAAAFLSQRILSPAARVPAMQFTFTAPPGSTIDPEFPVPSPDGSRIAFIARADQGTSALWIRRIDSSMPQRIPGSEGATGPSWSPDGRFIAFQSEGKLKKVDASGGSMLTIASMVPNLGSTWNADNVIVFAPSNRTPLYRVSADGGSPEAITTLDASRGENSHRWPVFLPDGRHFMFTARSDIKENTAVYIGSLDSKSSTRLLTAQSNAVYAPPGYVLFAREGTLMAQKFNAGTLTLSGEAIPLASGVEHITPSAEAIFATSADGNVLAYQGAVGRNSLLTWFDREGRMLGIIGPEKDFTTDLQISPDGKQAVVVIPDPDSGNRDLWLLNLHAGGLTRLTTHPANDWQPAWDPDSAHVAFASDRNGTPGMYRKATGGTGDETAILTPPRGAPKDYSADGRFLLFLENRGAGASDLWVAPRSGATPYPFVVGPFAENQSAFSPDGQWVAYESNESGTGEVYVKSFGGAGKQQVSRGGGHSARWKRDGTEIFYLNPANQLMRVGVSGGDTVETTMPTALFAVCRRGDPNPLYEGRWYDLAPDGRFLMPCATAHENPSITVTVGWASQLAGKFK